MTIKNYLNMLYVVLILLSALSVYFVSGAEDSNLYSVSMGGLVLQLQSQADVGDRHEFLMDVLTKTVDFLDNSFNKNYNMNDVFVNGYFSHVGLTVDSFELNYSPLALENDSNANGNNRKFFASVEFSGYAYFKSLPTPSEDNISTQLFRSFQDGRSNQEYISSLLDSEAPFLQNLVFAVVRVNGFVVASNPTTITGAGGGTQLQNGGKQLSGGMNENGPDGPSIQQVAIIVGALGGGFLILILCYCICFHRVYSIFSPSEERKKLNQSNSEVKRSSTGVTSESADVDIVSAISPPRSVHSIISQDSSLFTYNPSSRISFDASTITSATVNTDFQNNVDIEAWQRRNTINSSKLAPFGNDISAIEVMSETQNKKDLSLIEEGEEEHSTSRDKSNSSSQIFLQRERRADRDRSKSGRDHSSSIQNRSNISRDRSSSSRGRSRPRSKKNNKSINESTEYRSLHKSLNSSHASEDVLNMNNKSDIIEELNNLSLQINQHRGR